MKCFKIAGIVSLMGSVGLNGIHAMELTSGQVPSYVLPTEQVKIFDGSNGLIQVKENVGQDKKKTIVYTLHYTGLGESEIEDLKSIQNLTLTNNPGTTAKMWVGDMSHLDDINIDSTLISSPFFPCAEMEKIFPKMFFPIYKFNYIFTFINSKEIHITNEEDGFLRIKEIDDSAETTVFFDPGHTKQFINRKYLFTYKPRETRVDIVEGIIESFKEQLPSFKCFLSCYNRHGIVLLDSLDQKSPDRCGTPKCYYSGPGENIFKVVTSEEITNGQLLGMMMSEFYYCYHDPRYGLDFAYFPIRNKAFLNGEEAIIISRGQKSLDVAQWNIDLAEQIIEVRKQEIGDNQDEAVFSADCYDILIGQDGLSEKLEILSPPTGAQDDNELEVLFRFV